MVLRDSQGPLGEEGNPHSLLSISFWGMGTGHPKGDLGISVQHSLKRCCPTPIPSLTFPLCKVGLNRGVDTQGCLAQRDSG